MDWSYVAGYFDGEGTAGLWRQRKYGYLARISWCNTHEESLRAIQAFIGCGHMSKPRTHGLGSKPVFVLSVSRRADIIRVLDAMMPHLIIKRDVSAKVRDHALHNIKDEPGRRGQVVALTEDELRQLHWGDGHSIMEISRQLGVSHSAVSRVMKQRGIPVRSRAGMKMPPRSEETRARMRMARARLWADPDVKERHIQAMSDGWARWRADKASSSEAGAI